MSMHPLGSQQLDEGLDLLLVGLAGADGPPGASTSSNLATPEGEEKRDFHSNDLKQLHKPQQFGRGADHWTGCRRAPANA